MEAAVGQGRWVSREVHSSHGHIIKVEWPLEGCLQNAAGGSPSGGHRALTAVSPCCGR